MYGIFLTDKIFVLKKKAIVAINNHLFNSHTNHAHLQLCRCARNLPFIRSSVWQDAHSALCLFVAFLVYTMFDRIAYCAWHGVFLAGLRGREANDVRYQLLKNVFNY